MVLDSAKGFWILFLMWLKIFKVFYYNSVQVSYKIFIKLLCALYNDNKLQVYNFQMADGAGLEKKRCYPT